MMPKELLRKAPLFKGLADAQLDKVVSLLKERTFEQGALVVEEGQEGDEMYIVREGEVAISKGILLNIPGRGEVAFEKQLVTLGEGSYFGELALLAPDTRSATVKALTRLHAWVLESSSMQQLMDEDTDLGYRLVSVMSRELCHRLRRSNDDVKKLMTAFAIAINR